jgi:hypothetical protein
MCLSSFECDSKEYFSLSHLPYYLLVTFTGRRSCAQYAGQQRTNKFPRYPFTVKRILLTRDPKERVEQGMSLVGRQTLDLCQLDKWVLFTKYSGNAFGMRIIGGKSIPNTNGMIGAFVAKILPGGVVDTLGEVREGNQVMEWNGVPLTGKTHDEVQNIIRSTLNLEEVEVIIRADNIQDDIGMTPDETVYYTDQQLQQPNQQQVQQQVYPDQTLVRQQQQQQQQQMFQQQQQQLQQQEAEEAFEMQQRQLHDQQVQQEQAMMDTTTSKS